MAVKAKYIKDLPLKENLEGTDSLILQDDEGTKRSTLEVIGDKIAEEANKRVDELEKELVQTNTQLSQKANSNEVVKKGYGTLNDFDEETRRVIQGLSDGEVQINAVLGVGNVATENLADNSVDVTKFAHLRIGKNLYDRSKREIGYFVGHDNGRLILDVNYDTSDFIRVHQNIPVTVSKCRKIAIYDMNKKHIGGYDLSNVAQTFTPNVDGYIRVSFGNGVNPAIPECSTKGQVEYNDVETGFEEYKVEFTDEVKLTQKSFNGVYVPTSSIENKSITLEKCDFIIQNNLFNKDSVENIDGFFLNVLGGNDNLNANENYGVSHYIKVDSGTYCGQGVRNIVFYDKNKKYLKGLDNPTSDKTIFEVEVNGYVRLSYYKSTTCIFSFGNELSESDSLTKLSDDIFIPISDTNIVRPLTGASISDRAITHEHCTFFEATKNIYNKDTDTLDQYIDPNGRLTTFIGYRTSDYIRVEANTDYFISKTRKLCVYDAEKNVQIDYGLDYTAHTSLVVNIPFNGYIRISTKTEYCDTVQVEKGSVATEFEPFGYKLTNIIGTDAQINRQQMNHTIKLDNVDRIGFIGDSYTESHYTLKGKAYINKLSLFSDYNFENFAQSGDTYRGNLNRIRKGTPIYHSKLSWKDFKPTYALMISYTNDLKYMDTEQYLNDLRATIETVKALGAIPIISTEYHCNFGRGIQTALQGVANEYGLDFINILPKSKALRGKDYAPFWGGSHPGTRTNHILCDPLENYFKKMPRPYQSIKVFRPRTTVSSMEDLIFNSNVERARKFKEIMVGHSAINNPNEYDNCTTSQNSKVTSEYLKLLNNEDVAFENYALIDVILPSTSHSIETINLLLSTTDVEVYVKDSLAEPYPSPTFYQRFDFNGSPNFVKGAKYTSSDSLFGSQQFTVMEIQDGTVLMSPCKTLSSENGVLTKVSGDGDATVNYFYTAVGFSNDYPSGKLNVGHWVKIDLKDGKFNVNEDLIKRCMDYDKITFLVKKSGTFNISKIEVDFTGEITKSKQTFKRSSIDALPYSAVQKLPEQFVGNESQLSRWTKVGSINSYIPADKVLPIECEGCVDVTQTKKLKQKLTFDMVNGEDRKAIVRVWARYFPPIFDKNTMSYPQDSHITEDTFDYAELKVSTTIYGKEYEVSDLVGLGWKEVEFEIFIPSEITETELTIWSNDKDIQIAKASVYFI